MAGKSWCKNNRSQAVKKQYAEEFLFISDLLTKVDLPCQEPDSSDSDNEGDFKKGKVVETGREIDRAKTLVELNNRLSALKEQKYTYKGKKLKNRLQSKLKKKKKVYETKMKKNLNSKDQTNAKSDTASKSSDEVKPPKPIFNSDGNVVFSKFDFLGVTSNSNKDPVFTKENGNKRLALENLEKERNYIKKLEESGETEKASVVKEGKVWSNVLKKAEGVKLKDDPLLLKKSLARKKAKKRVSEKKWKERIANVEKQKEERQKKRTENLKKRQREVKKKKIKKAVKKGRVIPNA